MGLPRIGRAQHLHLAACPVIDADHQGQALPTPIYLLFSKKKESSALSSRNVLFWVGQGFFLTACHASLQRSTRVTRRSRDSGMPLYWNVWRMTQCCQVAEASPFAVCGAAHTELEWVCLRDL